MVNEVVPHEQLMETVRALARRIALVPEPSVRLNKAIAMQGIQAAGLHAGAAAGRHARRARAILAQRVARSNSSTFTRTQGTKAYLEMRDGPFQPEPMGPRSAKGRAQRAKREAPAS